MWLVAIAALVEAHAFAAELDPGTGQVVFGAEEVGRRFEPGESSDLILTIYDGDFRRTAESIAGSEEAIEQSGVLEFGGSTAFGTIDLRALASRFSGRRVEVRIWQRPSGTHARF